jgi:thiol-disulfide isomerase/thioredoxin
VRVRVLAFAAFVTSACGPVAPAPLAAVPPNAADTLPPLELRLQSGEPWSSTAAASAHRVLVIDVWATYCKPCRSSFPKLSRLAAAHPDVDVVGVSVDEDDAVVARFLAEVPAGFDIARDPTMSVRDGPLHITRLPTLLVVDRSGRVRFRGDELAEDRYDALPALVDELLAETSR